MAETYTSGVWTVKPGHEDDFMRAWFVRWASESAGAGTFRLVRDLDSPSKFMSFAPWDSFDAQNAWKNLPDFRERIGRVRAHCDDFTPSTYELVTQVN
jgi:heme-degrading monooxygenase HmoA